MLPDLQIDHISYLGIIIVLILTGSGLPLPEEVPILAAGVASSVGTLHPGWAYLACVVGAVLGDSVLYAIGYHFGRSLVIRHPRIAHLLHAEREAKIEEMIRRHGFKVFFLARFMVGIRAPVYLTAGVLRMSYRRFLLIDAICATSVVSLFFGLSYAYGDRVAGWIRDSEIGLTVLVVLVVLVVVGVVAQRHYRRRHSGGLPTRVCTDRAVATIEGESSEHVGEPSGVQAGR
jgi:membrane protein DedA with SNARE-associated domain